MKLLLDANLSPRLLRRLAASFPESRHVDSVGARAWTDKAVWDYAGFHGYTIVSKDNDFRQLSFLHGPPPKVVWLSVGNAGTNAIGELLEGSSGVIEDFLRNPEEGLLVLEMV